MSKGAAARMVGGRAVSEEGRPFIEDGSQFGVSKEAFRHASDEEKKELMVAWFFQNFEDPAERTPYESAEGGYQWIWGGPHDAREQIENTFGDIASETLIEEVVEKIEQNGTEWAPTPRNDDYDDYDPDEEEPPSLDVYLDERSPQYGSPQDMAARAQARAALEELRQVIDAPRPVGIGHNNPPADEAVPEELLELRPVLIDLQREFGKQSPEISLVKRSGRALRQALIASAKWVGRKVDKAVDAAMAAAGAAAAVAFGAQYSEPLSRAFNAIIGWLEIAARTVF